MHKITNIRFWLIMGFTSLLIAAGYEIRAYGATFGGVPSYIIAGISLILGAKIAEIVVDRATENRWIRGLITKSAHVEGYWYLKTDPSEDSPKSPLNRDGILYICHEPSIGETKVVTTRLGENGDEFPTVSEIAYVRCDGIDKSYLNYFRLTYPGPDVKFGFAAGRFIMSDDLIPYPNMLECHIAVNGENVVRRQSAVRIDDKIARRLKANFGAQWKTEALKMGRDAIFFCEIANAQQVNKPDRK